MNSLASTAVLEIGDSVNIRPMSRALAVQREYQLFFDEEGDLDQFPIFEESLPQPSIYDNVNMRIHNDIPVVKVHHIKITGAAFSAVVHIGSTNNIEAQSRIKHIRQLKDDQ